MLGFKHYMKRTYDFILITVTCLIVAVFVFRFSSWSADPEPVTLFFAGDVMLSRSVGRQIEKNGNDLRFPFLNVAHEIEKADIAFANLEGPISDRGERVGSIYSFRAVPGVVEGLRYAGFDILSLANNHIWDYGRFALSDTVTLLNGSGIRSIGAGKDEIQANEPAYVEKGSTTFAFLAYTNLYPETLEARKDTPGVSHYDPLLIAGVIRELKSARKADFVVVSLHWGAEYEPRAGTGQKRLARSLIDAGADMVIGHHPHVVQEVERYRDGLIAYSLGNFVFDQSFSTSTMAGLTLRVTVAKGKIESVEKIPVVINKKFQPMFADEN